MAGRRTKPSRTYFNYQMDSRNWERVALHPDDVITASAPKVGSTWTLLVTAMYLLLAIPALAKPTFPLAAEVLKTDDARIHARAAGDVATLSRIYADDYVLITAEGDVRSKQDQINELRSGKLRFAPLVPTERTIRLFGEVALVTSRDPAGIVRNGHEIGGDLRMVRVYTWRLGRWQLVSAQATRVQAPR